MEKEILICIEAVKDHPGQLEILKSIESKITNKPDDCGSDLFNDI